MRTQVTQRPLRDPAPLGTQGARAATTAGTVSKARVAGKACHLVALCLATWVVSKIVGVLHDLLQSGGGPARGLAGLVDILVCVLTLAVVLVAGILLAVLEGVAVSTTAEDEPASRAQRHHEWQLALLCAAPPGLVLLGLALVNAWLTW